MLLPERTAAGLGQEGFRFLLHTRVPTNDDVIQLRPGRAGQRSNSAALSLGAGGAESFARKGSRENGSRAGPPDGPFPPEAEPVHETVVESPFFAPKTADGRTRPRPAPAVLRPRARGRRQQPSTFGPLPSRSVELAQMAGVVH